eukprot:g68315.t1
MDRIPNRVKELAQEDKWRLAIYLTDWFAALCVFAIVSDVGSANPDGTGGCWYGSHFKLLDKNLEMVSSDSSCNFSIFMGVMTWLVDTGLLVALFLPVLKPEYANRVPKLDKRIGTGLHCLWALFWFCTFLNVAIEFAITCATADMLYGSCSGMHHSARMRAAVVFSCFCCFIWQFRAMQRLLDYFLTKRRISSFLDEHMHPEAPPADREPSGSALHPSAADFSNPSPLVSPGKDGEGVEGHPDGRGPPPLNSGGYHFSSTEDEDMEVGGGYMPGSGNQGRGGELEAEGSYQAEDTDTVL